MNLFQTLQKHWSDGSKGPIDGECVNYCHSLINFGPIGNTFKSKKQYVNLNGLIAANIKEIGKGFRIGDVVITSDGVVNGNGAGHAFFVADMDDEYLYAAESNFNLDHKVHYGRKVAKNDLKIYGIIRAPFKLNLGVCELNFCVFINNQPTWNLDIFDTIATKINQLTGNRLKVNFFSLATTFENWWYEVFPLNGVEYEVIARSYLDEKQKAYSFTNQNKPADVAMFVINPSQWQGTASGQQEIGWTNPGKVGQIQGSCSEFSLSPFYPQLRLIQHLVIHELSHQLHWINGLNDPTDNLDFAKKLETVYDDLDFFRIKANL